MERPSTQRTHTESRPDDRDPGTADRGRAAEKPSDIPAKGWKDIGLRVKENVKYDHMTLGAAGVAFYAFVAAVPAIAAAISIAGLVLSPERAREIMEDLFEAAPEEVSGLLTTQLENVAGSTGAALSISLAISVGLSLWAASNAMQNLIEAIGIVYHEPDDRGFIARRGQALLLSLGGIVFALIAIAGVGVVPAVIGSLDLPAVVGWIVSLLVWPLLGLALAVCLGVIYRVGPDRRDAQWRWVSWGAVIAVVIWAVASIGFQIYVSNFGSYNETYGSLAAVVIFLMWLFLSALAIILGAAVNAELEHQTARDTTDPDDDSDDSDRRGERPMGQRGAVAADELGDAVGR